MKRHVTPDHGLVHDLKTLRANRRQMLRWIAGASLLPLVGCATEDGTGVGPDAATNGADADPASCAVIPEETAGPYPGDGSNGANALSTSGIVRSDITTSFGGMSGTAAGIPLTVKLTLINTKTSCAPLAGYAIYAWHCDRAGLYSLYSAGVTNQNYLRGVQVTDANGTVTFQSIFPACYAGRWPHIHFENFPSLAVAGSSSGKIKTSQLALPKAVCDEVFATTGYSQSVSNLDRITLASDNVFSDGSGQQLASVVGSTSAGYVATLNVGISV
ncbi:MAG: Protocatechuate 3,4-dioxygenase beta subunit [Myxococcales bacterium]|nr:Protocatechuate 3,4-dioxygenase beta subunit [Myxococcales bacterium]